MLRPNEKTDTKNGVPDHWAKPGSRRSAAGKQDFHKMNYVTQPVETGDQTIDAISPALEFGEVIDLHPVYSAMAKARETADANSTEPEDVVWDPAWAQLEVHDDDYWNDLIDRNRETLSRWYAMSLKAGQKGKRLHFKVVDGVETASAFDAASVSTTKRAINAPVDDAPLPNCEMIRSHVEMVHMLAKSAGVDGVLTLTRIDDKDKIFTERFSIGDVDNHANAVIGWSTHPGLNLYIPWAIFRKDLPRWSKGSEADVVAALAFVGDLDADTGKSGTGLEELPLASPYVMETSEGNYQPVFPLARALSQSEAKPIAVALGDAIGADSRTKDTSSLFRIAGTLNWPSKKKLERGRSPVPQLVSIKTTWTGKLVEPDAVQIAVKDFVKPQGASASSNSGSIGSLTETFNDLPAGLQKQIASPPFGGEDQSRTAASVFSQLWRRGWPRDAIQALIEQYPQGVGKRYADDKKDLAKDIARSCEKFEAESGRAANEALPSSQRPVVQVKGGELSFLATAGEKVLIGAGVPLYQRGGTLVRPIIETVDATHGRRTKVAQLKVLDNVYMRDLLGRFAIWKRWDARSQKLLSVNPPMGVAATILARTGDWTFSLITGVISTPTMRPDGSLLTEQGFDVATGLLLVEPPPMPSIPDKPTREDALAALKLLEGLLTGFPFVDDVARACALSAIITPVVRGAFPVTPMHASRAPTAGTGKSFLFDTVSAIAIGQPMPVMSTGANTEEMEKRLGAAMLAGQPLISIDNISGELGGDALCQIIERPVVEIRILGRSERVRIEARGTSLFATGNNFVVVGDLCRRVITTNLDAAMERPELRQFKFDPVEMVLADRGKYIAAVLTICRAYFVAGRPDKAPRLASFEGWSDTVRSALIWLGKADPVKSMESARAEDPESTELGNMLEGWATVIGIGSGSRLKLAAAISKGMNTTRPDGMSELEPTHPEFHSALMAMAFKSTNKRGQQPDAAMLGNYLRKFKGKVIDGKRFMNMAKEKGGSEWWVEQVVTAPDSA
jgi:putative DNA primase/helicase